MKTLAHIVNPVVVPATSDLRVAQPVTFESMRVARKMAEGRVHIRQLTTCYRGRRRCGAGGLRVGGGTRSIGPRCRNVLGATQAAVAVRHPRPAARGERGRRLPHLHQRRHRTDAFVLPDGLGVDRRGIGRVRDQPPDDHRSVHRPERSLVDVRAGRGSRTLDTTASFTGAMRIRTTCLGASASERHG